MEKEKGEFRLRFFEIYNAFLEVEESLNKLIQLLHPQKDKNNTIQGEVQASLDNALGRFIQGYKRLPMFDLPQADKEVIKKAGVKVMKDLNRAEMYFPSYDNEEDF